jgi:hypothetical protein
MVCVIEKFRDDCAIVSVCRRDPSKFEIAYILSETSAVFRLFKMSML